MRATSRRDALLELQRNHSLSVREEVEHDGLAFSEWLSLMDEMHREAGDIARATVACEDADSQGAALRTALHNQVFENDATRAEVDRLVEEMAGECDSRQRTVMAFEEELSRVLKEQATIRTELMRACDARQQNSTVAAAAEQRVAELERLLDDASRVYAELAEDRQKKIAELEAWTQNQVTKVRDLEDHSELRRRQQREALVPRTLTVEAVIDFTSPSRDFQAASSSSQCREH